MVRCKKKKKPSPTATTLQIPDYLVFLWHLTPEAEQKHQRVLRQLPTVTTTCCRDLSSRFSGKSRPLVSMRSQHWRCPPNIETALQRNVAVKLHPLFFSHSLEHTHTPTHPTQECKNRPDPPPPPLMLPSGGLAIFSARLMLRRTELKEPLETKQWTWKMHRQRFLLDREIIQNCNTIF